MRTWFSAGTGLLVILGLIAMALPVNASCAASTPTELFQRADVIYYGRVAEQSNRMGEGGTVSHFAVERVLKGRLGPVVTLWEATGPAPFPKGLLGQRMSSSVDVGYRVGQRYIVFAYQSKDGWRSSTCSGTRTLATLTADTLAAAGFGELVDHLPGMAPDSSLSDTDGQPGVTGGSERPWWAVFVAGVVLVLATVTARRALTRRR